MRSFIIAAIVSAAFATGANAAQFDYFNKNTNPLAHSQTGVGPVSHGAGGGGGAGKTGAGGGGGGGKISAHCAPGAAGKACHR